MPDAEPDHRGDRRCRGAHVHHAGQQGDAGRADTQSDERDGDGQAGADHRAEGEHQDQQRDHDADQLALPLHRGGRGVRQVAAELDLDPGVAGRRRPPCSSGARLAIRSSSVTGASYCTVSSAVSRSSLILGGDTATTWSMRRAGRSAERAWWQRRQTRHACVRRPGRSRCPRPGCARGGSRCRPGPGVGDVPVVVRRAAEGAGETDEGGREHQPGGDRPPGVGRGGVAETVEET